jgi:hypothetical protein
MADPETTTGRRELDSLPLANLALGAAFALSALFPIGAKLLEAVGVMSDLRVLQPYQRHLVLALVSYWLPAIFIYVFLRLTRLASSLRPNTAVHSTIFLANLLLVLYVAARVYASTVKGGGGSFVVVSMGPLVILPAWALLAFGFIALCYLSLRTTTPTFATRTQRFTTSDSIVVVFASLVPVAIGMTLPIGKMVALSTDFARLCRSAEIEVLHAVKGTKSIALLPDSFSSMAVEQQAETRPWMKFLLNQSLLEFVERPATRESGLAGKAKYERVSTVGERILRSKPGSTAVTQFVYEPVAELTAEYEVRPTPLNIERGAELGLGGARIEIRRRLDELLVAYAQYYWNNTEFRACPKEAHDGLFIYEFVAGTLNVKNPEALR